jgi:hypothetical protein
MSHEHKTSDMKSHAKGSCARWLWRLVGPSWFWLCYSKGTQQDALNDAHKLLGDAWAAGRKDRLQNHADNLALPHEVRMFACDIANESHLKAARNLPRVIFQLGRFAITVSRPNTQA